MERKLWRIFSKYLTAMCYLIFFEWKHFLIEDFNQYFPNILLQKVMTFFMDFISKSFPVNIKVGRDIYLNRLVLLHEVWSIMLTLKGTISYCCLISHDALNVSSRWNSALHMTENSEFQNINYIIIFTFVSQVAHIIVHRACSVSYTVNIHIRR